MDTELRNYLEQRARQIAQRVVRIAGASECHIGGSLSAADILAVLYFHVLAARPEEPAWPGRDFFLLSKGHAFPALAAALALAGFIPERLLDAHLEPGGLPGHAWRGIPGVEASTGSLGHGLSLGVGIALALAADRRQNRVFVLLGDGELQEGSNWEAAMAAGHHRLERLVAIVDRNGYQTGPTEQILALEPLAAKWEAFGWSAAEVDGHDVQALGAAFGALPLAAGKPSVLIARTRKGHRVSSMHGVHAARLDAGALEAALRELGGGAERLGAAGPPRACGGCGSAAEPAPAAAEAIALRPEPLAFPELLLELAAGDERIFGVGCDTWHYLVPMYRRFPERVVEVGIAEQNLVGVAAGLALAGKIPFVVGLNPFLTMRAFEQIRTDVAYGGAQVKIVGGHGSGVQCAAWGPTHHAQEEAALMRAIPGMTVLMPSDAYESEAAVRAAARSPGPFYIALADGRPEPPGARSFRIGRAVLRRPGRDLCLLSTGALLSEALLAADALGERGISARVLAFPTLKPIDREAVRAAAAECGLLLAVEEHSVIGGLGSAVAEILAEEGLGPRFRRLGLPDRFLALGGTRAHYRARLGLDAAGIAAEAARLLGG